MAFYSPRNITPADQILFDANGDPVGIQPAGSSQPPLMGLTPTTKDAVQALVSADGIAEAIGAGFGRTDMQRPGQAVFNWANVTIGTVTAGWTVEIDPTVKFGGLPVLKITSSTTTALSVTITLPAGTSLGNTKRLQMAIRCGDSALGAGGSSNALFFRCNYSASGSHRIFTHVPASHAPGDWQITTVLSGDAVGVSYMSGTPVWDKVNGVVGGTAPEDCATFSLTLTPVANVTEPIYIAPLLADIASPATLILFFDGLYSGQYKYARRILAAHGLRASLACTPLYDTAGYLTTAQIRAMYDEGHDLIYHTGAGALQGWDNTSKYPDGSEYALVKADVQASENWRRGNGWTRGLGYGVVGNTNGLVNTQTLARRTNIANALRDAGLVKIRQLSTYLASHHEVAGNAPLLMTPSQIVTTTASTSNAAVQAIVDKVIARGGISGLTYHDIVLTGESGNNRNVDTFAADIAYIAGKVAAGSLRVLPMSKAFAADRLVPQPLLPA